MAGTPSGGKSAAATNKEKYGPDFYSRIGSMGGKKGRTGGFASEKIGADGLTGRQRASVVGEQGGRKSRRQPSGIKAFNKYYENEDNYKENENAI